jgi:hypothetical protein
MREKARSAMDEPDVLVLSEAEAERRMGLLADLKAELDARGVVSVLARRRRLVLHYNLSPCPPSGLTDPQLHVFTADRHGVVTADGRSYRLASGASCPAGDPGAAAAAIAGGGGLAAGKRMR